MPKEDYIILELPMCPSLNKLFSTITKDRRGRPLKAPIRSKSKDYKEWIELADIKYRDCKKYTMSGDNWLEVHLNYFFPIYNKNGSKKIKDTGNYEKAMIDFLATKIEGFEDHYIKRIVQEKHDSKLDICKILIKEIN